MTLGMPPVYVCIMEIIVLPHRVVVRIEGSNACKTLSIVPGISPLSPPPHRPVLGTRLGRGGVHYLDFSLTKL